MRNIKQGDSVKLRNHLWDYKNINLLFYFLNYLFNISWKIEHSIVTVGISASYGVSDRSWPESRTISCIFGITWRPSGPITERRKRSVDASVEVSFAITSAN